MEPHYSLSECLKRYAHHLRNQLQILEGEAVRKHDAVHSLWSEIRTVEYWVKIAEEAERGVRLDETLAAIRKQAEPLEQMLVAITGNQ